MKKHLSLALCLLLLAGCSSIGGEGPHTPTSESNEPWEYGIAIENGYETQEFTVTLMTKSGRSIVNETHRIDSGAQWKATTLTESKHSGQDYLLAISATDEGNPVEKEISATSQETVSYTSGATLYKFGPSGTGVYNCGGNATCYLQFDDQ
ncbi:hypothetical protein [Halosimplex sp. TS25]|uniref:hypothetical protein n=1 Tax=Halosimplex rarum TaxID=3396619 RepID=UPI0039EBE44D